jgi:ribosomal protein S18 acetylase RimI-like enzyme
MSDAELYRRATRTLISSWEEYARGARDAGIVRAPGVVAAVFAAEPERAVYNNAVLEDAAGIDAMEAVYAAAGVGRFAVWTREADAPLRRELERRGYTIDETTRAMAMELDDLRLPRPELDLAPVEWAEYLRIVGVPQDFLAAADPAAYEILVARLDGANVATAMAYDCDGDRGIYNVGTLEHARRRGLGTALTALLVHDARDRGLRTASLQSTPMAERVYAAVGFRDLGRIVEYVRSG